MEMIIFRKIKSGEKAKRTFNDENDDLDDITELFQTDVKNAFNFCILNRLFHILTLIRFFLFADRTGLE